jgi:hypothetical protein
MQFGLYLFEIKYKILKNTIIICFKLLPHLLHNYTKKYSFSIRINSLLKAVQELVTDKHVEYMCMLIITIPVFILETTVIWLFTPDQT